MIAKTEMTNRKSINQKNIPTAPNIIPATAIPLLAVPFLRAMTPVTMAPTPKKNEP
jgi:hypothetical protein